MEYQGKGMSITADCVEAHAWSEDQIAQLKAGALLDLNTHYTWVSLLGQEYAWLSESMRDDKNIRNVYLPSITSYYGENVFRGSALETVVFPLNWISDHITSDGDVTGRASNAMAFGKEAVIIEANSFADCTDLKSVIFPSEPARLYFGNGVFANCPNLTVYAPAGGYIEQYCKDNGIKFVAIAGGYLESKYNGRPGTLPIRNEYDPAQPGRNLLYKDHTYTRVYVDNFDNCFAVLYDRPRHGYSTNSIYDNTVAKLDKLYSRG